MIGAILATISKSLPDDLQDRLQFKINEDVNWIDLCCENDFGIKFNSNLANILGFKGELHSYSDPINLGDNPLDAFSAFAYVHLLSPTLCESKPPLSQSQHQPYCTEPGSLCHSLKGTMSLYGRVSLAAFSTSSSVWMMLWNQCHSYQMHVPACWALIWNEIYFSSHLFTSRSSREREK